MPSLYCKYLERTNNLGTKYAEISNLQNSGKFLLSVRGHYFASSNRQNAALMNVYMKGSSFNDICTEIRYHYFHLDSNFEENKRWL